MDNEKQKSKFSIAMSKIFKFFTSNIAFKLLALISAFLVWILI